MTSPSTRGDNPVQAGSVDQSPGEPMPTTPDDVGTAGGGQAAGDDGEGDSDDGEDDLHANFRAALMRKNYAQRRGEEHRDAHGAGPAHNDRNRRQFRRKSG